MPVYGFDHFLRERNLVKEAPLAALKDTRLGIDAQQYLRTLLDDPKHREPCVSVTGGAPLNAYPVLEQQLRLLEHFRIKPIFVFPGLSPIRKDRPFVGPVPDPHQAKLRVRDLGWDRYIRADQEGAMAAFAQSSSVQPSDVFNQVHRLFRTRHVEYLVSPYFSWAQLVYLERHPKQYIHSIYGANELLMFDGVERIILGIDWERHVVRFVTKQSILADLSINAEQFLDACVLAGFDPSPTFPYFNSSQPEFYFRQAVDMVRQYRQGISVVQAYADYGPVAKSDYADQFVRARCWIKYSLVTAEEGRVVPLPLVVPPTPSPSPTQPSPPPFVPSNIPSDLHEIFTHRFPEDVYYQLCRAMVSPVLLNVLASGQWVEPPPLCGGETEDYTSFVQNALTQNPIGPRCVALALLGLPLHQFWQQRNVNAIYYFDPSMNHLMPFASTQTMTLVKRVVQAWNVPAVVIEEELKRQNSSTIDISLCLGATSDPQHAARTRVPRRADKSHRPFEKKDEVVANTLWRFLELRGYLTPEHSHTAHGSALHRALKDSKVNDKLQEPLLLVIELIKAGVLHAGRYGGRSWVGSAHRGNEEDQKCMLIVMRTLLILPLQFKAMAWQGPLSRDLLVFNSFLRSLGRSLRHLVEATALSMVLRNDTRRSREDGNEVALSLPFQQEANTGMGILFKGYADMMLQERDEKLAEGPSTGESAEGLTWGFTADELAQTKTDILDSAQDGFPMVRDVATELNRGFRFWDAVMTAVRSLKEDGVLQKGLIEQVEAANRWLAPLRLTKPAGASA